MNDNIIKVFHYTFWKEYDERNRSTDTMNIHKRCYIGHIEDEQIILPNMSNDWVNLRLDNVNVAALRTDFDYDDKCICIDYFTIDEMNGYENFVKLCFNALGNEILYKKKVKVEE